MDLDATVPRGKGTAGYGASGHEGAPQILVERVEVDQFRNADAARMQAFVSKGFWREVRCR